MSADRAGDAADDDGDGASHRSAREEQGDAPVQMETRRRRPAPAEASRPARAATHSGQKLYSAASTDEPRAPVLAKRPAPRGGQCSSCGHQGGGARSYRGGAPRQPVMTRRTVPDAVDRQHIPGPMGVALQLPADILDVRVDGALERFDLRPRTASSSCPRVNTRSRDSASARRAAGTPSPSGRSASRPLDAHLCDVDREVGHARTARRPRCVPRPPQHA